MKKMKLALSMLAVSTAAVAYVQEEATAKETMHTVKKSETVYSISKKYGVSTTDIIKWNGIKGNTIKVGQKIYLTNPTYTVKSGDTLYRVAINNGTTMANIRSLNNLKTDTLKVGQVLRLIDTVSGEKQENTTVNKTDTVGKVNTANTGNKKTYTVKSGDTLYRIATTNGLSMDELKALNGLKTNSLKVGQILILTGSSNVTEEKKENEEEYIEMTVESTAYTATCAGCSGITYTGINLKKNPDIKLISVDPSVIPLGSKVWVEGYGEAIAGDKGKAIKGKKIDVFYKDLKTALKWGRKAVKIKIYK